VIGVDGTREIQILCQVAQSRALADNGRRVRRLGIAGILVGIPASRASVRAADALRRHPFHADAIAQTALSRVNVSGVGDLIGQHGGGGASIHACEVSVDGEHVEA
jgi:hypothetical protein